MTCPFYFAALVKLFVTWILKSAIIVIIIIIIIISLVV